MINNKNMAEKYNMVDRDSMAREVMEDIIKAIKVMKKIKSFQGFLKINMKDLL
jgi:hypothetical protein